MDQPPDMKPKDRALPTFEKGIPPKERPDMGPKQDQKFPEQPEEAEPEPVPDMDPSEQGDH